MHRLSDSYYQRKCFLETNQVPTQSIMKEKMSEPLAKIYFDSMTKRHKVYAGLEPPMKGGGTEWYMPPEELLVGRAVLKPIEQQHIKKLNSAAIREFGAKFQETRYQCMQKERQEMLLKNDNDWKVKIKASNDKQYTKSAEYYASYTTEYLLMVLKEFENMYRVSITKIEETIAQAANKEIKRIEEEAYQYMNKRLKQLLQCQFMQMRKEYHDNLNKKKDQLKKEFIAEVENIRSNMAKQIHDSNYEKHLAIEKLRHFLECRNLACQIYVAIKEKEECEKELEKTKHQHKKVKKTLEEEVKIMDFEIKKEIEHQAKRNEFIDIWKKKICHVVKKFQTFVEYCLHQLPEYADFFIDMEKLMLLQLSEAYDVPDHESNIINIEPKNVYNLPAPKPKPFHLFCDTGTKPEIHQNLFPRRVTSSDSQFPVIVIGNRCIYSACDNLELFADKIAQYVYGNRGDDDDIKDDQQYDSKVPVKYTSLMQLLELKLESSLMQVIQKELPNTRNLPIECGFCKLPYCFCTQDNLASDEPKPIITTTLETEMDEQITNREPMSLKTELQLRREPKWESYSNFVATKRCKCAKTAQKQLHHNLPPYMKITSPYVPPELPNYETCSVETLRSLVNRAFKIPRPLVEKKEPISKDADTQYSDHVFDEFCTCLSDEEVSKLLKNLLKGIKPHCGKLETEFEVVNGAISPSSSKSLSTFATARAHSLRLLLDTDDDLKEIFRKSTCD